MLQRCSEGDIGLDWTHRKWKSIRCLLGRVCYRVCCLVGSALMECICRRNPFRESIQGFEGNKRNQTYGTMKCTSDDESINVSCTVDSVEVKIYEVVRQYDLVRCERSARELAVTLEAGGSNV